MSPSGKSGKSETGTMKCEGFSCHGKLPLDPQMHEDQGYRYRMPPIEITQVRKHGGQTELTNLRVVARRIRRDEAMVANAIAALVGVQKATTSKSKAGVWVLKGAHEERSVQEAVYDFISAFVLCPRCRDPGTMLEEARKGVLEISCGACGNTGTVDAPKRLQKLRLGKDAPRRVTNDDDGIPVPFVAMTAEPIPPEGGAVVESAGGVVPTASAELAAMEAAEAAGPKPAAVLQPSDEAEPQCTVDAGPGAEQVATPEVVRLNVGVFGHVSHGKSTLVRALTGKQTAQHSSERKNNCTIKLGYADAALYRTPTGLCWMTPVDGAPRESCHPSTGEMGLLIRVVSFVDCPGHAEYMGTMLSGAATMDAALLVVSAADPFPQPQAKEHIRVAVGVGLPMIVAQNKVDVAGLQGSEEQAARIRRALPRSVVVPCCATRGATGCEALAAELAELPVPSRDVCAAPLLTIVRSFDVNRPGVALKQSGVLGGTLVRGQLRVGDAVEVRPGRFRDGAWEPLGGRVESLFRGATEVHSAGPGGLVGVRVSGLDPSMARGDGLVGQLLGLAGSLPAPARQLAIGDLKRAAGGAAPPPAGGACKVLYRSSLGEAEVVCDEGEQLVLHLRAGQELCAGPGDTVAIISATGTTRLVGVGTVQASSPEAGPLRPTVERLLATPFPQVAALFPEAMGTGRRRVERHWGRDAPESLREALGGMIADGLFDMRHVAPSQDGTSSAAPSGVLRSNGELAVDAKKAHDGEYRYRMPRIGAQKESRGNGARTVLSNLGELTAHLGRGEEVMARAIASVLGVAWREHSQQDGVWVVQGHHSQETVQSALYEFITHFVLCPSCSDPRTHLVIPHQQRDGAKLRCPACGQTSAVRPPKKLARLRLSEGAGTPAAAVEVRVQAELREAAAPPARNCWRNAMDIAAEETCEAAEPEPAAVLPRPAERAPPLTPKPRPRRLTQAEAEVEGSTSASSSAGRKHRRQGSSSSSSSDSAESEDEAQSSARNFVVTVDARSRYMSQLSSVLGGQQATPDAFHLPRPVVDLPPRQKHTFVLNFAKLAKALHRPTDTLRAHVEATLQAKVRVNSQGQARIDKPLRQKRVGLSDVREAVTDFARRFVQCAQCRRGNTETAPGRCLVCRDCGASRTVGAPTTPWEMGEGERRRVERAQKYSRRRHGHVQDAAAVPESEGED
eukprot:Hpha_TRINITY_DN15550_c6_g5::TRINITY_DN15550_c6_g5_i1::g.104466::m.104466/K03242/EIF2S3; translation initiation factor 2 subunit 3